MSILIQKAGILDTFQDLGRTGYRKYGINTNGAMDQTSIRAANILLGNDENSAALEMHFPAPVLEFRRSISFVLSGADFEASLDGNPIRGVRPHTAQRGSILRFSGKARGRCCYLSVKNGFLLEKWLSSGSTNLAARKGGFEGRELRKGDKIRFRDPKSVAHIFAVSFNNSNESLTTLRFLPGPSYASLTALSELEFLSSAFVIGGDSNRMGFRLTGKPLHLLDDSQRLSAAVTFGTVQVLPDGGLIILMADHQTTGGYPNLGTIIGPDISVAGQLERGDGLLFVPVTIEEALKARLKLERDFALLKTGLRLRKT